MSLGDGFVQVSSIMPQKRNPVALEHARSIGSKALGQATAVILERAQHAVRRHRRHRGRPPAACTRRSATRCARLAVAASLRTALRRRRDVPPRRGGVHHRHRAGRHADPRTGPALRAVARIAAGPSRRTRRAGTVAARAADRRVDAGHRRRHRPRSVATARDPVPVALRPRPRDARRSGAVADRGGGARRGRHAGARQRWIVGARARLAAADRDRRAALEAL